MDHLIHIHLRPAHQPSSPDGPLLLQSHMRRYGSDSVLTVGELASHCVLYKRCFLPSVQPCPLIFPRLFSLMNIRYARAFRFSDKASCDTCLGRIVLQSWSCFIYFMTASIAGCPYRASPCLRLYWVSTV